MAGEPQFFTRNYVDLQALITTNNPASDATRSRLFDRDSGLKFKTSGLAADASSLIITIDFLAETLAIARTIDTIAILGHNLRDFLLEYWNGAAFVAVTGGTIVANTAAYTVVSFVAVSTQKIRLTVTKTNPANAEKEIGEILAMGTILTMPTDETPSAIAFSLKPTILGTDMMDFGTVVNQLRWAGNRVRRFRARIGFSLMPKATYDLAVAALLDRPFFTVHLEPVERPDEFYLVSAVLRDPSAAYMSTFKGQGYALDMELSEV